ncbi:MAG: hypothetical protein ACTSXP_14105, partial [Promethearchaeota archaeon]
ILNNLLKLGSFIKDLLNYRVEQPNQENEIFFIYNLLKGKGIINVFFTLALLFSFTRFYNENLKDKQPTFAFIEEIFPKIYENLNLDLNTRFLKRDLQEFKEGFFRQDNRKKHPDTTDIRHDSAHGDIKRNFFAHSGFESTFIDYENGVLNWKPEKLNTIRAFLEKPN